MCVLCVLCVLCVCCVLHVVCCVCGVCVACSVCVLCVLCVRVVCVHGVCVVCVHMACVCVAGQGEASHPQSSLPSLLVCSSGCRPCGPGGRRMVNRVLLQEGKQLPPSPFLLLASPVLCDLGGVLLHPREGVVGIPFGQRAVAVSAHPLEPGTPSAFFF